MIIKEEKPDHCTCAELGKWPELHTCPFAEDVNNDPFSLCTCCPYCTEQCAQDI